jgi:hypothetical protein
MSRIIEISAIAILLFVSPAFAVDLSVDQTARILMPDGKTPKMMCDAWSEANPPACTHKIEATVGSVIQNALEATLADPSGRGADPSNGKAGNLAIRSYGAASFQFKLDEIQMILSRVERSGMDPVTIARMQQILEPEKADDGKLKP